MGILGKGQLGSFILGADEDVNTDQLIEDVLELSDVAHIGWVRHLLDTLTLTDVGRANILSDGASQGLSFVDGCEQHGTIRRTVSDSLTITSGSHANHLFIEINDSLSMDSDVGPHGDIRLSRSDTLTMTSESEFHGTIRSTFSQTLTMTSDVHANIQSYTVPQTLTMTQDTHSSIQTYEISHFVELLDNYEWHGSVGYDFSDFLTLSDEAGGRMTRLFEISDTCIPQDEATHNFKYQTVSSTLSLVDGATIAGLINEEILDSIELIDTLALNRVSHFSLSDTVLLQDAARSPIYRTIEDTLDFLDFATFLSVQQTLTLTDSIVWGKGKTVLDTLTLVHALSRTGTYRRPASSTLGVFDAATFFLAPDRCTLKNYAPLIGSGTGAPSGTPPTLGQATLTLSYPFTSPTTTLVLRNPDFGNRERLTYSRINRTTRGGTLTIYSDPLWPKQKTLKLTIGKMKRQQATDLITFVQQTLGCEIKLLDWENRQWKGMITTPDLEVSQPGKNDYSTSFEFEGELVEELV